MITVSGDDGTEVFLSESKARPGATQVIILAPTPEATQRVIEDLSDEWGTVSFTIPTQCDNQQWMAVGLVSGAL